MVRFSASSLASMTSVNINTNQSHMRNDADYTQVIHIPAGATEMRECFEIHSLIKLLELTSLVVPRFADTLVSQTTVGHLEMILTSITLDERLLCSRPEALQRQR